MPQTAESPTSIRPPACGAREPVAHAPATLCAFELARRVAATDCTVLLGGESGTGKEVLAQYVHRHSARAGGPFVAVNCAAIPESMLESLLFGWERGAFTGALTAHPGKFGQAQGGTLLLDEVSELPLGLQAKLLRVLQEREVERLGARAPVALDVRVLATTNRRLREEVAAGRFREDLFYRLNVFPIELAPLRERREDILPLAMVLLSRHCHPGSRIPALSADAAQRLLTYPWPGNVRELDNLMQRALVLCNGPLIEPAHILFEIPAAPAGAPARPASDAFASAGLDLAVGLAATERELIFDALRVEGGRRHAAAQRLGISPRTLRHKLARLRAAGYDPGKGAPP
jgi:two-component system response regulator FlrC